MKSSWPPSPIRRVVATSSKCAPLLLALAMSAVGLTACGGGSGSTSSTVAPGAASAPATTSAPAASTPTATAPTTTSPPPSTAKTATATTAKPPPSEPSPGTASGGSGGAAASFRVPRGDNSIPDYGSEAPPSERARATAALAAFLRARSSGDWATVCVHLAGPTSRQMEAFTKSSKSKGCGPGLAALSTGSGASRADPLIAGVAALRIKGASAFALFRGPHGSKYVMPMTREGGAWKMGQVAPLPYPLGTTPATP